MTTKRIKGMLTLLVVFLLSACGANVKQETAQVNKVVQSDDILQLKQTRSQLQFELSSLSDEWWQRSGELDMTSSSLPLLSNNPETIGEINRELQQRVDALKMKIVALNNKVIARKRGELAGTQLTLRLKYAGYKGVNQTKAQAVASSQVSLVQGESTTWSLQSKKGDALPIMRITLSETNQLFIEGQLIAQLETETPTPSFITSVTLYGKNIFAVGKIDMMLAPTIE